MACQSSDTSLNEFTDENLSFLDMELETLQSIFINELEVKEDEKSTTISIDLHPSTADKLDEQYVRMTLEFVLEEEYPEKIPEIKIRNPRGLSDEKLMSITEDLLMIAESKKGSSMLFEMIHAAKEHLTAGNRPSGECAICLHAFSNDDVFTKTECYHYFHSHCLARYAKNFFENSRNSEEDAENNSKSDELLCPMCRIPIEFDEWDIDYPLPEESSESSFTLSGEMVELQKKMAVLFQKQVEKGGIIDVEAEKNKYLLEISTIPDRLNIEDKSEEKHAEGKDSVADSKTEPFDESGSPARDRKEYARDPNKRFDNRGRYKNFYRPIDNRNSNRYDYRYNKQSYNRGNFNRYRHGKQNSENSYRDERERTKDSSPQDLTSNESPAVVDDAAETSRYSSPKSKNKYNPNFSPRYNNRGYRHGRNNYNNYDNGGRRNYDYYEQANSKPPHRYSNQREEDSSFSKSDMRVEDDHVTHDDSNPKSNYRSGGYKRHNDYYAKQRYSDNRNNSQHGFKGAYNGRDSYASSNNFRGNRYRNFQDKEQYSERNYREKRTYNRDLNYKNGGDTAYNRRGSRNYSESRPERYSERSYREPSYNESESLELNNQTENVDKDALHAENGSARRSNSNRYGDTSSAENGSLVSSKIDKNSSRREESLHKNDLANLEEKRPDIISAVDSSSSSNVLPNAFRENSDVIPKIVNPPPGFANPLKKVVYGLQGAKPPPGFNKS